MSNESVYERFGMCHVGVGKKCGVVKEEKKKEGNENFTEALLDLKVERFKGRK